MAASSQTLAGGYFDLTGKTALVTGASSGLGAHFAETLAAAGCVVGLAARREDRLSALTGRIAAQDGKAVILPMDVTDRASVEAGLDALGPPDILVNNAGMPATASFIDADDADTARVFGLNQMAAWQVAQAVCRRMIDARTGGSIINIASITGLRTVGGAASYAVSKAAVIQMTKVMALELARHDIRVNALAPGYFNTELNRDFIDSEAGRKMIRRIPMRRTGELHELDGLLLLLASGRSTFMTGAVIPVDGGHAVSGL